MGGRYRESKMRSGEDDRRRRGLSRKSMDRFEVDNLSTEGLDDANATSRGAETHRRRARQNYPCWDRKQMLILL